MGVVKDVKGMVFGRLTVLERAGTNKWNNATWKCQCDCGNISIVTGSSLRSGTSKSCGCLQRESAVATGKQITHGLAKRGMDSSGVYKSWGHMKQRCLNENNQDYHNYGARGITVCEEWLDFSKFYEWALANGYKKGLSIDRIDNDGNYEPGNCRWATWVQQQNNKRNSRVISFDGKEMTLAQWSEKTGINYNTLNSRLNSGWSIKKTLTTPLIK